jgi:6-phosphogluconate dehydrogenase
LDKTGSKGTGKWTVQEAAEQGVAAPAIASSLDARYLSARKEERMNASTILQGPKEYPNVSKPQILEDLAAALFCSKICSYAQGLDIIKNASDQHGWNVNLAQCARMWRGGCIIRAKILDSIAEAFSANPALPNLMVAPNISENLNKNQLAWRRIVTLCIAAGIPCPTLSSSLSYFDSYRRASLPANLTQAQRDFFGGHTYERVDKPNEGPFHCVWTSKHKGIGDVKARTAGEVDLSHV